jgi:hypothetical protein
MTAHFQLFILVILFAQTLLPVLHCGEDNTADDEVVQKKVCACAFEKFFFIFALFLFIVAFFSPLFKRRAKKNE